jgi:transcriptional regulator with XRE-family HTH domain
MIAASCLRSEGFKQGEIADRLGVSQPEVSRLLTAAVKAKMLSRGPTLLRHSIQDNELEAAEREFLVQDDLSEILKPLVPRGLKLEVRVAAGDKMTFAFAAAGRVTELVRRARCLGVLWGRSVSEVVNGIVAQVAATDPNRTLEVRCIPLCGDPVFQINNRQVKYSASNLAGRLGEVFDARSQKGLPCLSGVPAYISRRRAERSGATVETWRRFVQGIPGYEEIFGKDTPRTEGMIKQVDTIITGLGIVVRRLARNGRFHHGTNHPG